MKKRLRLVVSLPLAKSLSGAPRPVSFGDKVDTHNDLEDEHDDKAHLAYANGDDKNGRIHDAAALAHRAAAAAQIRKSPNADELSNAATAQTSAIAEK